MSTLPDIDTNPFAKLIVIDMSSILAGPLAGTFFAELGAKVIKIENKKTGGDTTRQWKLPVEDQDGAYSAYYFAANYGKETILLDFTNKTDLDYLHQLLSSADIVISNFQKVVALKFGLTPSSLKLLYPELVITQLSAYTYEDERAGYDIIMQGETGWISMTGTDGDNLAKLPVALIDVLASHQMKEAILIAMIRKLTSQKGCIIHVSLYKSALSALANQGTNYLMSGHIPTPMSTIHPNIAPYGEIFYDINGEKFLLAVGSDAQFKKMWFSLNFAMEEYSIFEYNSARVSKRKLLYDILQDTFSKLSFKTISESLSKANVPFCKILNLAEVFEDRNANGMIHHYSIDDISVRSLKTIAFYFS